MEFDPQHRGQQGRRPRRAILKHGERAEDGRDDAPGKIRNRKPNRIWSVAGYVFAVGGAIVLAYTGLAVRRADVIVYLIGGSCVVVGFVLFFVFEYDR